MFTTLESADSTIRTPIAISKRKRTHWMIHSTVDTKISSSLKHWLWWENETTAAIDEGWKTTVAGATRVTRSYAANTSFHLRRSFTQTSILSPFAMFSGCDIANRLEIVFMFNSISSLRQVVFMTKSIKIKINSFSCLLFRHWVEHEAWAHSRQTGLGRNYLLSVRPDCTFWRSF